MVSKKCILVVDDDAVSRSLLKEMLTPAYAVIEGRDGNEAVQLLKTAKIDLVITDRDMPGMNGLHLLRYMQESKLNIPSLMVSGFGEEGLWAEAIGLGAGDYILKPFRVEDVLRGVQRQLGEVA